jgi:hypothetical protein
MNNAGKTDPDNPPWRAADPRSPRTTPSPEIAEPAAWPTDTTRATDETWRTDTAPGYPADTAAIDETWSSTASAEDDPWPKTRPAAAYAPASARAPGAIPKQRTARPITEPRPQDETPPSDHLDPEREPQTPSWAGPTEFLSQIGRAGDLTPAQAYRAGQGRSW